MCGANHIQQELIRIMSPIHACPDTAEGACCVADNKLLSHMLAPLDQCRLTLHHQNGACLTNRELICGRTINPLCHRKVSTPLDSPTK